ncbi:MAG: PAS domain S-box protein [Ginsengibacter sp.]
MTKIPRKIISSVAAVTTGILGIMPFIDWFTRGNFLRLVFPVTIIMKFHVALGFVFSSVAVLIHGKALKNNIWYRAYVTLCVLVCLVGVLTLVQYFSGINYGIDEFFTRDALHTTSYRYANQMSPFSAIDFLLIGIGLLFLNKEHTAIYQFCYVAGITFLSLLILISFNSIYDNPSFILLSIYDAVGFIVLCTSIYFAQPMLQKKISFERKLFTGFIAVIILIAVLSIFSSYYSDQRVTATKWVKHTNEVLNESKEILYLTKDMESQSRGYIITGDSNYLRYFVISKNSILSHNNKIKDLTKDNSSQRLRIDSLSVLGEKQIDFLVLCIRAKNEKGSETAKELMATPNDRVYTEPINNIIVEIQQEENNFLVQRQKENNKSIVSFNRSFYVLLGSIFILLVIILFSINHNTSIRKRAEEKVEESERMFSTLFYKSPILKAIIDVISGKYIEVNDAFVNFLGVPKERILGKTLSEINMFGEEELAHVLKNIRVNGFVREFEMQLNSTDGKACWVSANIDLVNLNGRDCFLSAGIDITKRKIAEDNLLTLSQELESIVSERTEELNRSEKSYRYLFENNPMPMWVIDLKTFKFLDINEMAVLQYGYTREEFLSMTAMDIRPETDKERFRQYDRFGAGGTTNFNKGIWSHVKKDKTIIQVEIIAHSIIFEGIPARFILSNDVTEKLKAEEKLSKSEKFFRAMIEKDTDMKTLADPEGNIFYTSPSLTKILGYESKEFMTMPVSDFSHPEDIPGLLEGIADILQSPGKSFYRQQRLKHKNGTWLWCEGTITNMLYDPAVGALVSNFRDITERKQAEEAILLAEANYREIFDKASDGIYVHEIDTGRVIEVNKRASEITGYSREELLNNHQEEFITDNPEYTFEKVMDYLRKAAAGEPQLFEWMMKNKDNSINWLEVTLKNASIAGKERILSFFREINDRKKAQLEIQELNEELEQKVVDRTEQLETANKELEAFSYSVSHDLRAPLRAINGFAKMLGENYGSVFDNEGLRLFNRIKANAKKMGILIDDLLEFSRLGRKEIHKSSVQMTELTKAALGELNTTVTHKATIKINKLHAANADSAMIKQVMINLLSNAIKYSSKNEDPVIEVKSSIKGDEIIYCVSDNGVGFDYQFVHKLFGVFQRLHLQADFEGTGVGLALVKRIITKHGGNVWAVGELEKGATFYFSLPVAV